MWQFNWLLSFIPDSIFIYVTYILMGLGLTLYIASKLVAWLPIISRYKTPAEIIGVVLLVAGAYVFGSYGTEMAWRERVKELEEKVAKAEAESKKTNIIIKEKIVTKVKEIMVFQDKIKEVIVEKEKIIDAQCKVPSEAVAILNEAAKGVKK